jgi:hypothetical protein
VSSLGRGSAFAIWLPAAVVSPRAVPDAGRVTGEHDAVAAPATEPPSGEYPALADRSVPLVDQQPAP